MALARASVVFTAIDPLLRLTGESAIAHSSAPTRIALQDWHEPVPAAPGAHDRALCP